MANRTRDNRLEIKLTDKEMEIFRDKMCMSNSKSMAHFIRKCVLEKDIYVVELTPFRKLQSLLSNATNNLNQIAKHANTTGIIYFDDIKAMKKEIERFSKEIWQIHSLLLKRTSEKGVESYGNHKNSSN